jgi:hypothetical protein
MAKDSKDPQAYLQEWLIERDRLTAIAEATAVLVADGLGGTIRHDERHFPFIWGVSKEGSSTTILFSMGEVTCRIHDPECEYRESSEMTMPLSETPEVWETVGKQRVIVFNATGENGSRHRRMTVAVDGRFTFESDVKGSPLPDYLIGGKKIS